MLCECRAVRVLLIVPPKVVIDFRTYSHGNNREEYIGESMAIFGNIEFGAIHRCSERFLCIHTLNFTDNTLILSIIFGETGV